jgi:D-ribose pyranase
MKNNGVIHPDLVRLLAQLGHGDELLICDAGFPIPAEVERIDLAYRLGSPPFADVVESIVADITVESIVAANETGSELVASLEATTGADRTERVSHAELKKRAARSRGAVRTGETTPYANVILVAGVAFS